MDKVMTTAALVNASEMDGMSTYIALAGIMTGIALLAGFFLASKKSRRGPWRLALGAGLLATPLLVGVVRSPAPADDCRMVAEDPQLLKSFRTHNIRQVREYCGRIGVTIGDVQV